MTLDYGNYYGKFLIMGNAGFISSTIGFRDQAFDFSGLGVSAKIVPFAVKVQGTS